MTRSSGFSVSAAVRLRVEEVETRQLRPKDSATIQFTIPDVRPGVRIGFGGWFVAPNDTTIAVSDSVPTWTVSSGDAPIWRKFGSQWGSDEGVEVEVVVTLSALKQFDLALYGLAAGHISESGMDSARPELLGNMWTFSPEANFHPTIEGDITVALSCPERAGNPIEIALKSCNRCGRFLPINLPPNERSHLSFSNHCIAKAPCRHASFGRIQDEDDPEQVHLMHFGFQLECRYCKKFFVNAALNPQRTAGQMKEDGARRRAFEVLLEHLNQGSPQFDYKRRTGRDLAADVFDKFGGRCFKCGVSFGTQHEMHLDHTRPLALLWPLDEHATALCSIHNSEKRDRPPAEYYTRDELRRLSSLSGLPLSYLEDPSPNTEAINLLGQRLDWFFDSFIPSGELDKVREGKATAELLVKALQKAIDRTPGGPPYDLVDERLRRGK